HRVRLPRPLQHERAMPGPAPAFHPRMAAACDRPVAAWERERRPLRDVRREQTRLVADDHDRERRPAATIVQHLAARHDLARGPHRRVVWDTVHPHGRDSTKRGLGSCEMDVSIVVTVLNEEDAVDELYRRVSTSLNGSEW